MSSHARSTETFSMTSRLVVRVDMYFNVQYILDRRKFDQCHVVLNTIFLLS